MTESEVSLVSSAKSIFGSRRLWPILTLGSVLLAVSSLMSVSKIQVVPLAITVLVAGYEVCVARAVLGGGDSLPSPFASAKVILRRGLSSSLVMVVPLVLGIVALISLLVAASGAFWLLLALVRFSHLPHPAVPFAVPRITGAGALAAVSVLLLVAMAGASTILLARYVAFDRLREGFRFVDALRRSAAHATSAARVFGWTLAGSVAVAMTRYVALWAFGLSSTQARAAALTQLATGMHRQGLVLVAIDVGLAVITAPWELVAARLLGQYAAVAFGEVSQSGSVEQAYRADGQTVG